MTDRLARRWTGFWLSLALPGLGQLLAWNPTCLAWFAGTLAIALGTAWLATVHATLDLILNLVALALFGLASAEHAKRCLEPRCRLADRITTRVSCDRRSGPGVCMRIELELARSADALWGAVADFPRFVGADPFHRRVIALGGKLSAGVPLALEHCAFGFSFWRFGKLLRWREGQSLAFSDLSARGPHHGFPHVFFVDVLSLGAERSRLVVTVRGKWTAAWVPHWLRRCWLSYVCREHARLLAAYLSEAA